MQSKKNNIITVVLLFFVVILVIAVVLIGRALSTKTSKTTNAAVAPKKVKASNVSYSKLIVLTKSQDNPFVTTALSPTVVTQLSSTPGPTVTSQSTPTVTEMLLAASKTSPTVQSSSKSAAIASATATVVKSLPVTGVITNSLMILLFAASLVFLSLVL